MRGRRQAGSRGSVAQGATGEISPKAPPNTPLPPSSLQPSAVGLENVGAAEKPPLKPGERGEVTSLSSDPEPLVDRGGRRRSRRCAVAALASAAGGWPPGAIGAVGETGGDVVLGGQRPERRPRGGQCPERSTRTASNCQAVLGLLLGSKRTAPWGVEEGGGGMSALKSQLCSATNQRSGMTHSRACIALERN